MADVLRIKRRVSGAPGAPAGLANAELAYNEVDHILYYGEGTGGAGGTATVVIPIGGSAFSRVQSVTALRLLGNPTGSAATASEITLGTGLSFSGTVLNALTTYLPLTGGTLTGALRLTGSTGATEGVALNIDASFNNNVAKFGTELPLYISGTAAAGGSTVGFNLYYNATSQWLFGKGSVAGHTGGLFHYDSNTDIFTLSNAIGTGTAGDVATVVPTHMFLNDGRIAFGNNVNLGTGFPAFKRVGANVEVRLSNDSALTIISAATPTLGSNDNQLATTAFVLGTVVSSSGAYLPLAGGTLTGALSITGSGGATDDAVLNIDASYNNNTAKFGPYKPLYIINDSAGGGGGYLGFNLYWSVLGNWLFGKASTSGDTGGLFHYDTVGNYWHLSSSTAPGAAGTTATVQQTHMFTNDGRIAFGPNVTSSAAFPAFKRVGAGIEVRTANDSALTLISAATAANGTNTTQLATTAFVLATRHDQLAAPTTDVSWNSRKITSLLDPTNAQDAATKNYVDGVVQGIEAKQSVKAATTANITLSAPQTIDGVGVIAGDRVLVKNQTLTQNNGVYIVAAGTWTRSLDADTWNELISAYVFVEQGTANIDNGFLCTVDAGGTIGTTPVTWVQFSGAGQVIAGTGLTKTGNQIDVIGTAARIIANADSIDIDAAYVGQTSITTLGTVATGTWAASTIPVNRGGTGATTLTGYLVGNGTGAFTTVSSIPNTGVSGLGTMSTQNATAVAITGGTIDNVTFDMGTF